MLTLNKYIVFLLNNKFIKILSMYEDLLINFFLSWTISYKFQNPVISGQTIVN